MKLPDVEVISNVEAERSVIGAILLRNDTFEDIGFLAVEDFYHPGHRVIFAAMAKLKRRSQAIDILTLEAELGSKLEEIGGSDYLLGLAESSPGASNAHYHAGLVKEKATLRRLESLALGAIRKIQEGEASEEIAAQLSRANDEIHTTAEPRTIAEIVRTMKDDELRGVSTGHGILDNLTGVGYVRGQVSLLSAISANGKSTGAGKSWFGVDAFSAALQANHKAMFATFADLSDEEVVRRVLKQQCGMGGRPRQSLERIPDYEDGLRSLTDPYGAFSEFHVYDGSKQGMDIETFLTHARKVKRKKGLDFLVVDYIQKVRAKGIPRSDRTRQLEYISDELKLFAAEEDLAILELSQLTVTKKGDDEQSMTAYSAQVEHDAALILELRRNEHGTKWKCTKNRFGMDQVGGYAFWDNHFCRFADFALEVAA
jgi:replicative DNA helicase